MPSLPLLLLLLLRKPSLPNVSLRISFCTPSTLPAISSHL